jgi:hypothetical protein
MALTVEQGFTKFLETLTPTAAQRAAANKHRSSVESSIEQSLTVKRYREIGSFGHGTGVRGHADVDLLVSLYNKPLSSDTALGSIKNALSVSFPYTDVYVRRPAVVVDFTGGDERWEIVPAFLHSRSDGEPYVYDIPGAAAGWMLSAPVEHIDWVNEINQRTGINGGTKKLARLIKACKYYNNVPVSSFYLEMRAAQYREVGVGLEQVCETTQAADVCGTVGHGCWLLLTALPGRGRRRDRQRICQPATSTSGSTASPTCHRGTARPGLYTSASTTAGHRERSDMVDTSVGIVDAAGATRQVDAEAMDNGDLRQYVIIGDAAGASRRTRDHGR